MPVFLILFIAFPLAELALLILVGQTIGVLFTLALVILTAVIGIALLQRQGYAALASARRKMEVGRIPAEEMVNGVFLAVGGMLLLLPGFITDLLGLCCLLPGIRRVLLTRMLKHFFIVPMGGARSGNSHERVIEGKFERERRDPDT